MTLNFTRVAPANSRRLFPDMIKLGWGRIINITGKSEPEGLNAAFSAKAGHTRVVERLVARDRQTRHHHQLDPARAAL